MDRPNGALSNGLVSTYHGGRSHGNTIAGEQELEAFSKQPVFERRVGEALRGILAETATTGVVRYSWSLLRPLVAHIMEQVLREFDAEAASEHMLVGPPRPPPYGPLGSIAQTVERFRQLLYSFNQPPWTLQRICEILLEPRKQYSHLHKVSLALEKCLLVTSELRVPAPSSLPAPPLLSSMGRVNENPPSVYQTLPPSGLSPGSSRHQHDAGSEHDGGSGRRAEDDDGGTAFTGSLLNIRPGGAGALSAAPAHFLSDQVVEEPWPPEPAPSSPPMQPSGPVLTDTQSITTASLSPAAGGASPSPFGQAPHGSSAGALPSAEATGSQGTGLVRDAEVGVLTRTGEGAGAADGEVDPMQVDSVGSDTGP